jgi:hypothetical protein
MPGTRSFSVGALAIAALARPALADEITGSYEVKIEQLSTNCEHPLLYPARGSLKISMRGGDLIVDIDRTPLIVGHPDKTGQVSAKTPRPGHTPIAGMDGVFTIAGRITSEGMLRLTMVGEYQAQRRPLCTQTWNLSGLRATEAKR